MRRRVFAIASAVSFILCVATVTLWIRSYWRIDFVRLVFASNKQLSVYSEAGSYTFNVVSYANTRPFSKWTIRTYSRDLGGEIGAFLEASGRFSGGASTLTLHDSSIWGFEEGELSGSYVVRSGESPRPRTFSRWYLTVRYSVLAGLLLLLPVSFLARLVWNRRQLHELACRQCHYNLTANTSGICPECGTAVAEKVQTTERQ
jgi:hypothetical protein